MRKMMEEYGLVMVMAVVVIMLTLFVTPIGSKIKEAILGATESNNKRTKDEVREVNKKKTWVDFEQISKDGEFRVIVHTYSDTDDFEIKYQIETPSHPDFCKKDDDPTTSCPIVDLELEPDKNNGQNGIDLYYTFTPSQLYEGYKIRARVVDKGTNKEYITNSITYYGPSIYGEEGEYIEPPDMN